MREERRRRRPVLPPLSVILHTALALLVVRVSGGSLHSYVYRLDAVAPLSTVHPGLPPEALVGLAASDYDDGPGSPLAVPFPFPFFGETHSDLVVIPNGALLIGKNRTVPCCPAPSYCGFFTVNCTFAQDYRGLIGAYVTDLNPSALSSPVVPPVSAYASAGALTVAFTSVPLYFDPRSDSADERLARYTFTATMFPSGRVTLRYESVTDPRQIPTWSGAPYYRSLLVGLRAPPDSSLPAWTAAQSLVSNDNRASFAVVGSTDLSMGNGVFPPSSGVVSGRMLTWYPAGFGVCVFPRSGPAGNGSAVRVGVDFVALAAYAADQVTLVCRFSDPGGPPAPNQTLQSPASSLASALSPGWEVPADIDPGGAPLLTCQVPGQLPTGRTNVSVLALRTSSIPPDPSGPRDVLFALGAAANDSAYYDVNNTGGTANASDDADFCNACVAAVPALQAAAYCWRDCADVFRGGARIDRCGSCYGGTTGLPADVLADCAGQCNGSSVADAGGTGLCGCLGLGLDGNASDPCASLVGPSVWSEPPELTAAAVAPPACASPRAVDGSGPPVARTVEVYRDVPLENGTTFACEFGAAAVVPAVPVPGTEGALSCEAPVVNLSAGSPVLTVRVRVLTNVSGTLAAANHSAVFVSLWGPGGEPPARPGNATNSTDSCRQCGHASVLAALRCDCAGVRIGNASVDACGVCAGGTTGRAPDEDLDCAGYCSGPFVRPPPPVGGPPLPCSCPFANASTCRVLVARAPPANVAVSPIGDSPADRYQPVSYPAAPLAGGFLPSSLQVVAAAGAAAVPSPLPEGVVEVRFSNLSGDVEFASFDLGFTFDFYGTPFRRVQVSPLGAVHFVLGGTPTVARPYSDDLMPPGLPVRPSNDNVTADSRWPGLDAFVGLQLDFDASKFFPVGGASPVSRVFACPSAGAGGDREAMTFLWLGMWPSGPGSAGVGPWTFAVTLFAGGGAAVSVVEAHTAAGVWPPRYFLGTRPSRAARKLFPDTTDPSVPVSQVANGTVFRLCFVGSDLCVGATNLTAGTEVLLAAGPASSPSCHSDGVPLSCSFGGTLVPATWRADAGAFACPAPPGVPDSVVYVGLVRTPFANGTIVPLAAASASRLAASYVGNGSLPAPVLADREAVACRRCPGAFRSGWCSPDCNGDRHGNASLNGCGVCFGGLTGLSPENGLDCSGVCFGPFHGLADGAVCSCTDQDRISGQFPLAQTPPFALGHLPSDVVSRTYVNELGPGMSSGRQGSGTPMPGYFGLCTYYQVQHGPLSITPVVAAGSANLRIFLLAAVSLILAVVVPVTAASYVRQMTKPAEDADGASQMNGRRVFIASAAHVQAAGGLPIMLDQPD